MTKMTIATKFDEVVKALNGENSKLSTEELIEFINDRKEKAEKKSASKKPTKTQEANAELKEVIVTNLAEANVGMAITEMIKTFDGFEDFTPQKISALANQLVREGRVEKYTEGKKSLFRVA